MKKLLGLLIFVLLIISAFGQPRPTAPEPNYILLKNATIIDVISGKAQIGNILLKDDRIEKVDYTKKETYPDSATIYNLTGKFVIPGLLDNHVHITHGTFEEAKSQLEKALKAGVTGVRDMGGDGRMLTLLKKNMQIGEYLGSDVYFGVIIAGPTFFRDDPRPQAVALGAKAGEVSWQRAITPESDFRQIIAEAKGLGAAAIKIYTNVDKDLIKKISDEAKRQGLKVWGHGAIPPTRPLDVSNSGVEVLSHAGDMMPYELNEIRDRHSFKSREEAMEYRKKIYETPWDTNTPQSKELLAAMKKNNNILDATMFVYYFFNREKDAYMKDPRFLEAKKFTKVAYDAGIRIGAGTDSIVEDGTVNLHKELELLVDVGLTPIDALRAATIVNAEEVGEEKQLGSIENGKIANLVVLNASPLEKIGNTRNIKFVIKRGRVIGNGSF